MELQKKLINVKGRSIVVFTKPELEPKVDLASMTKAALIALAEKHDVEVSSRMTKAKIIEALEFANV